jgi:biopolymer transport protein ExbD
VLLLSASLTAFGEPARTTVVLTSTARGDMTFEGPPVSASALLDALRIRRAQGDPIALLIRGEPTTSYEKVGTALARANEAGIAVMSYKADLPAPSHRTSSASSASGAATC